ncbi:hypothetical protein J2794_006415 [Paraburkholderia terricola]|nr:hypothetical protein [Paraburkholderia terricola]
MKLDDMLKELGTVTIRYTAGMFRADSDCSLTRCEPECSATVEGAVRNALFLKRQNKASPFMNYATAIPFRYFSSEAEIGEIPTAGQDSY